VITLRLKVLAGERWGLRLVYEIERSSLDPYAWATKQLQVIKSTASSLVGLVEIDEQPCYLKFYLTKSRWQWLWFRLGLGRGPRSFKMANELLRCGILVPRPLACVLAPRGMILLTEAISDATDMQTMWERGLIGAEDEAAHCCWHTAGTSLAQLHNAGFVHGDYKWSNLIYHQEDFYLVDLEAVTAFGRQNKKRYRDLARFILNAEDMGAPRHCYELFMSAYLDVSGELEQNVVAGTMPFLSAMRSHHIQKYGPRGHALMGL
jgi:tRNA A-37 threonylcarbamoyl transferase component Bud32